MMKNNNKKKGSTAKKLMPAAMMLAVSASMLGTSTYAWFTMNKTVEVKGLKLLHHPVLKFLSALGVQHRILMQFL
jgi:hypothetical protein